MLSGRKQERSADACYNVAESRKHETEWEKPGTKGQYYVVAPAGNAQNRQIHRVGKQVNNGRRGLGEGRRMRGTGFLFVVIKIFWNYLVVIVCTTL